MLGVTDVMLTSHSMAVKGNNKCTAAKMQCTVKNARNISEWGV